MPNLFICLAIYEETYTLCLYRKESCKKAFMEGQGLVMFGNKLKLSPVDRDGTTQKLHTLISMCVCTVTCVV